jgi:tetratricopeptide (TPR) repeat protein
VKRFGSQILVIGAVVVGVAVERAPAPLATITIDYPAEGSIFPPEIIAPTFLWRDAAEAATAWLIEVAFADGSPRIQVKSRGERLRSGEIDARSIAETNEPPKLTPQQAAAHTWGPDAETWAAIKEHSVERPATVTITGFRDQNPGQAVSRGRVAIQTSKDPVGAPIFYRDVPLMPTETEKGVIKPIVPSALPLIGWRLRNVGEPRSRLLMERLPTCANCHSFSRDGKTLGMDLDGPQNDKSMYAIAPIAPQMSIRNEDVIVWNSFPGMPPGRRTIAFMPQLSPDGQYAVATLNEEVYVANFKDYRFLQVFYPTRGILAWYSRATGRMQALPGADDPRYVHTNAVWSPDGSYLVFARAKAREAYPEGRKLAQYANDPNETPIRYDLYRIPFNAGQGGRPKPIPGASRNGMSNAFPRISPDGRWIVFVQCRNGQLMRPDGQLHIVPAAGGRARRMRCNTPLMNSWHSFSPNGRWLVFASKSRSPYTQMFLTHLDAEGSDSPAILIDNATAANRAVNLPEFVNIPPDGLLNIDVPAAEFYRLFDSAWELAEKGQYQAAIAEWRKALEISPEDAKAHNNFGTVLWRKGAFEEAIAHYRKALEVKPGYAEARNNLAVALVQQGRLDEAIAQFQKALELKGESAELHSNLGRVLADKGKLDAAIEHWRKAVQLKPNYAEAHNDLGTGLFQKGRLEEAIAHWQKAVQVNPVFAPARFSLGDALYSRGKIPEALGHWREGLRVEPDRPPVLRRMAWVLATWPEASVRNGMEAVALAERALRLSGGREPAILDTLAAAYAEAGRFPEAVETARRALALATQQNQQPLAEALKARIGLYEGKSAFRGTEQPSSSRASRP